MTKAEEVYAETLNLLGSDPLEPELQELVDREHAAADPAFARVLAKRQTVTAFIVL
jgi:hypothetical protein